MKKLLAIALCYLPLTLNSQTNPEVYLLDMVKEGDSLFFLNPSNISNNAGYDNQPSFFDDEHLLFSSTRDGQTDIKKYRIKEGNASWISDTPNGSEYSPLRIPGTNDISAIRLDNDGTQLLYRYSITQKAPEVLLKGMKVGYHLWFNKDILITTVLIEGRMDLVVTNFMDNSSYTVQRNVGRSLHKIPNSNLISYVSKDDVLGTIKSLDPVSGATKEITRLFLMKEDVCWLADGTLLTGYGNMLYSYQPNKDNKWKLTHVFKDKSINMISRLAVNPNATRLALVADISPEEAVQKQIAAFNKKDLDAFLNTFSDDAKVYGYGGLLLYQGKQKIKQEFATFFDSAPDLNYSIKKKVVMDNKVHHEALITANNKTLVKTYYYTVANGKISSLTFYVEP
ncbi:nuclear transport factor 2 family protein [Sediminicola sp. YIK13]|uniref:nuclear transport factor 2 family protein n=1 Tax=Sediminicola sp. YIK13 TaxID=1453352 RepID=UPI0007826438|nr:nuclear transport factor 2 family protein [Sediminicola sp. YIK13]